ncbi:hypothetical protein, partial [Cerasicoccus arenae]|uniref:hypothetical protein n=1 Tax=Cerasicoccus arenae TaxID=424488 RepID=UPI001F2ED1A5
QRTVRSDVVIKVHPFLKDEPCLRERVDEFPVERPWDDSDKSIGACSANGKRLSRNTEAQQPP